MTLAELEAFKKSRDQHIMWERLNKEIEIDSEDYTRARKRIDEIFKMWADEINEGEK